MLAIYVCARVCLYTKRALAHNFKSRQMKSFESVFIYISLSHIHFDYMIHGSTFFFHSLYRILSLLSFCWICVCQIDNMGSICVEYDKYLVRCFFFVCCRWWNMCVEKAGAHTHTQTHSLFDLSTRLHCENRWVSYQITRTECIPCEMWFSFTK